MYLSTYAVEYFGSARPHAHRDDQVHRLHRALAAEAGVAPQATVDHPRVYVDGLVHASGRRYLWLVNLSPDSLTAGCRVPPGCRLTDVLPRADRTDGVPLAPFGVAVVEA